MLQVLALHLIEVITEARDVAGDPVFLTKDGRGGTPVTLKLAGYSFICFPIPGKVEILCGLL